MKDTDPIPEDYYMHPEDNDPRNHIIPDEGWEWKEQNPKTDNELIAIFMGINVRDWNGVLFHADEDGYVDIAGDAQPYWPDKSWNHLMPVVEKINETEVVDGRVLRTAADVCIFYKACTIEYSGDEESGDDRGEYEVHSSGKTKIEAVYKAVVEFIKWYNKQQNIT